MKKWLVYLPLIVCFACNNNKQGKKASESKYKTVGELEKIDPSLDSVIIPAAKAEIIAEGMDWSEGPVWVESQKMLLFSDVPRDTVFKWTEEKGKEVYLTPSGYSDTTKRGGEMGSNGLLLDKDGHLVLCQHGNRQMARMDASLNNPVPKYISLASMYKGKKFNSPNDAVYNSKGELFFTDPPYGLEKNVDDPKKEIPFQGVFKRNTSGNVSLVADSVSRPNGIAFFPDEQKLLVSSSDPAKPNWYLFDLSHGDSLLTPTVFYSAAGADKSLKGLPDGMKIDNNGNVFATGPGGLWIFNKDGKLLGKYKLTEAASNCAFSPDQKTLYITNDMYLLRLKLK